MPSTELTVRPATPADAPALFALLADARLPTADVDCAAQDFLLAFADGRLVGSVGLERRGADGLLRSLAVVPELRHRGLGGRLHDQMVTHAALRGVRTLYLLTTTAERFFAARAFERVDRAAFPEALRATPQFTALCPATAACMRRHIGGEVRHFPADALRLRPSVPGASMWAVGLERAMLTYFEIAPRARFERHRHESEQISLVLEGELVFELDVGEVTVRAGEVIAIPGNAWHAARAGDRPARAVDAWSPVRADYLT
jgi:amino-acid N-acetyltransferase